MEERNVAILTILIIFVFFMIFHKKSNVSDNIYVNENIFSSLFIKAEETKAEETKAEEPKAEEPNINSRLISYKYYSLTG